MAGPSTIARPHPSSLMAQSTTMNISWPPEANGNGTGSFVLQVNLNGQPPTNNDPLPTNNDVPITNNEMPLDPMSNKIFQSPHSPGIYLHIILNTEQMFQTLLTNFKNINYPPDSII